jgi:ATP-dependent Clp protease, protease subunit
MKSWYSIKNKSNTATVSIDDEIGFFGVSARDFLNDVRNITANLIKLNVHSPGGNMFDGFAMYNGLKNHPATVHGSVTGIAASAAATVLMASDYIEMPEDSFLMIHNAQGGAYGEKDDLREMADLMEKMEQQTVNIYSKKSGLEGEKVAELMNESTWMSAQEALELGFIDNITGKIGVQNNANLFENHFKNMPFMRENSIKSIENERELEKFVRESGVSREKATVIVAASKRLFQRESGTQDDTKLIELLNRLDTFKLPERLI